MWASIHLATTICTVLSEMQAVTSDAHLFLIHIKKSKQILPITDKMFQAGDAYEIWRNSAISQSTPLKLSELVGSIHVTWRSVYVTLTDASKQASTHSIA